jgi:hypothetical protein
MPWTTTISFGKDRHIGLKDIVGAIAGETGISGRSVVELVVNAVKDFP